MEKITKKTFCNIIQQSESALILGRFFYHNNQPTMADVCKVLDEYSFKEDNYNFRTVNKVLKNNIVFNLSDGSTSTSELYNPAASTTFYKHGAYLIINAFYPLDSTNIRIYYVKALAEALSKAA